MVFLGRVGRIYRAGIIGAIAILISLSGEAGVSFVQDAVRSIAWNPDGAMIAISGGEAGCDENDIEDFAIRIFDVATGEIAKRMLGMTCTSTALDWSPDGRRLASLNVVQAKVYIWDVVTEELLSTTPFESQGMSSVVWSPNGDLIASAFPGNGIILWNPETGQIVRSDIPGTTVDWSPDGNRLVRGSFYGNSIKVHDVATGEELLTLRGATDVTYTVHWSPYGDRAVSSHADDKVHVWDMTSGRMLLTINVQGVSDAQWSPNAQALATTGNEGVIQVWNANTGEPLESFTSSEPVWSVAWSPDSTRLAYFDAASGALVIIPLSNNSIVTETPSQ